MQAVNWLYGTFSAEAVAIVIVLTLLIISFLIYLMFSTHNELRVWSLSTLIALIIFIVSSIIIGRVSYLNDFLKFPANAFIGLILGFFIAAISFYTSSKRLRRKEVIEVNPLMRIVLVVTFLSYLISGLVSSNKELDGTEGLLFAFYPEIKFLGYCQMSLTGQAIP